MAVLHYNFHSHPKIVGLSKAAIGVYALALSYASGNLTDGFVPDSYVRSLDRNHQSVTKRSPFGQLIAAGLVTKTDGGYAIRDYLDYNPTKAQVVEKRRLARERMNRVRANTPTKKPKRAREQEEDVTPNVRDIGLDNPSTNLAQVPSSTVVEDAADSEESVSLDVEALNVVDINSRRVSEDGYGWKQPLGPILDEILRRGETA